MECRAHTRYTFNQPARLKLNHSSSFKCHIVNYCAGGVLIKTEINLADIASEQKLNLFDRFDLEFDCLIDETKHSIVFQGDIRRMDNLLIGIEFHQPPATSLSLLNNYLCKLTEDQSTSDSDEYQTQKSTQANTHKNPEFIHHITQLNKQFWRTVLDRFFNNINNSLFELSDRAHDNQQQTLFFEAIDQIKKQLNPISNSIDRHLQDYLGGPPKAQELLEAHPLNDDQELEVIEKNTFEDWLEIQMVISSAESDHFSQLYKIHQYLSQLYNMSISSTNNPVGPYVICQTFKKSVAGCHFNREILTVIYQCFQTTFMQQLTPFYDEIVTYLSSKGFTAETQHKTLINDDKITSIKEKIQIGRPPSRSAINTSHSLQSLMQLQRTNNDIQGVSTQHIAPENYFDIKQINHWLGHLPLEQKLMLSSSSLPLKEVLLQSVREVEGDTHAEKHISHEQLDLADIIDNIFGLMTNTGELNKEILTWINQLKIPLLNVTLNDPSFLNNPQHPARQVIEKLIRLGSVDRVSTKSLERTVKTHILKIVNQYDKDNNVFNTVSSELTTLIERQEKAFIRNAERVAKSYEGQQKLEHTKRHILNTLAQFMVGHPIPAVTLDLLNECWRSLLVVTCIRDGEQSSDLKEFINVLRTIALRTSGSSDQTTSQLNNDFDLDIEAPALLELIARQLAISSAGIINHQLLLDTLHNLFYEEQQLTHLSIDIADLGFDITPDTQPASDGPSINCNDNRWSARIHAMQVGDWIEYEDEQKEVKRMRLIWTGDDAFKFVFVNNQGMKEIEFDANQLIKQLDSGNTILVDESEISFVDKSLFNTVQTVYEQMVHSATHDTLTGLLDRHEFEKQLTRSLNASHQKQLSHALCYLDINQFSVINNNHGNHVGDALLKNIASRIKNHLNDHNILARIGGNEYGILLLDCNKTQAMHIANNLQHAINDEDFTIDGETFSISISAGLEMMNQDIHSVSTIIKHANLACRSAKQSSAHETVCYQENDIEQVHQDSVMNWVGKIDDALNSNLLQVRCQKIASTNDSINSPPHYEVLLGVVDDAGNLTSPEDFIEAAEQFNRMPKVDRWVVNSVFEWMESHQDKIAELHGLSINLSGRSINDDLFLQFLLNKIRNSSIACEKLCFEVTETATISNLNYAADFINEVKKTGCKFSLDDFGTGMASYEYLQKLPFDYLKIDGIFIKDIATNSKNYAMVKSINELGHFLGKETIAEYVENDEILEIIKEIGIDHAQGFGIEKPVLLNSL